MVIAYYFELSEVSSTNLINYMEVLPQSCLCLCCVNALT